MNKLQSVCVVLVTYNRQKCLAKVIHGLKNQTYPIGRIFIFDNASTDNTEEFLESCNFKIIDNKSDINSLTEDDKLVVYKNDQNLGGSGGFANAIKLATKFAYNYLWIMDDDVFPEKECLATMFKVMNQANTKAVIPNRTDENYKDNVITGVDFSSVMKYTPYARKEIMSGPITKDYYYVADMAFEGPLLETDLIRKIGNPDDGFFLEYDDSDYAQRIQKFSKIAFASRATLHRQLAKKNDTTFVFKGKRDRYNWRSYYTLRNNIVFERRYGKNWMVRNISPRLMYLHKFVKSLKDGEIKNNLPILNKAYSDGIHERMGKRVDPGY